MTLVLAWGVVAAQDRGPDSGLPPVEVVQEWFPEDTTDYISTGLPGWLPYYLELRNNTSKTQEVRIDGVVSSSVGLKQRADDFTVSRRVEVHPGPPRKAFLYLWYPEGADEGFDSKVSIRVWRGEEEIHRRPYTISGSRGSGYQPLPILVSGEGRDGVASFLRNLGQMAIVAGNRRTLNLAVDQPAERMLPDDPIGYHSTRVLILRDLDEKELEDTQVEALLQWVYLGGVVIVVPSKEGEIFSSRLVRGLLPEGALAPVQLEEGFRPDALAFVDEASRFEERERLSKLQHWKKEDEKIEWSLVRVDPVDPRVAEPIRVIVSVNPVLLVSNRVPETARRVYHEVPHGAGRVGFLTVDALETPDRMAWSFQQVLWTLILADIPVDTAARSDWNRRVATVIDSKLVKFLKEGLSPDLGIWFIGGLVLVYLLVVGPGIYFFLKRINRLPWVVWLQPAVVVVYVGLIFLTGYLTKGVLTETRLLSVLHWKSGEPYVRKESYLGIFSSDDSRYHIASTGDRWLRPVFANRQEMGTLKMTLRGDGSSQQGSAIRDFRLDVWQTGVFATADLLPRRGEFTLSEDRGPDGGDGGLAAIELINDTPYSIRRGFYFASRASVVPAGPLPPGGRVRLDRDALAVTTDIYEVETENGRDDRPDPFDGDDLARDAVRRLLTGDTLDRLGSSIVFVGLLDRRENDFAVAGGSSLKHRADLLVVYR